MSEPATRTGHASAAAAITPRTVRWVVPAYNEAASIAELIERIAAVSEEQGWTYRILVVDDGSGDGTGAIAAAQAPRLPVEVVRHEPNRGLGHAIRAGLRRAAQAASPDDVIVTLDADLTQDPAYAPPMLAEIDRGADVVIASRYRKGSAVRGLGGLRRLLSYGASAFVMLLRPVRGVRDYSCGYRAYRASTIAEAFARDGDEFVCESGFGCMVEIAEGLREHATFAEVPFVLRYDEKRRSSAMDVLPTIGAYARVLVRVARRQRKPVPWPTLAAAVASVILGSLAQVALRTGAAALGGGFIGTLKAASASPWIWGGLVLYGVSSLLWLSVLSRLELAIAYPIGATGYVLVVLMALASGESVPPSQWSGIALIVIGILLVGWLGVAPRKRVIA